MPETHGELESDEALETLRATGRARLVVAAFERFRAADGFSHARALGFQLCLTVIPALIALIGFATATDRAEVRDFVRDTLLAVAPGEVGQLLTTAIRHGSSDAAERGETALVVGVVITLLAGTVAMAQVERGANRIYGLERDRGPLRRYGRAALLACTAGTLVAAAVAVVVAGDAARDLVDLDRELDVAWALARWPAGVVLITAAVALLFRYVPNRRQPETSWLAVGAAVAVVLWLALTGVLALYVEASDSFGATYGPLAGVIGLLLWAFLSSVALFLGLSFAAQLEAVRAGAPGPRLPADPSAAPR